MAQTTVQTENAIRFGSAKWEMGANVGALVNVGALRNAVWEYRFDKITVKSDNAGTIKEGIRNEECGVSGDLMEVNLENLASFYSGVLSHDTVAGALTPVTDEEATLSGTTESALEHRNGDGTEVESIVVTDSTGATTLVRDCDFVINVNADGKTTIARAYPAEVISVDNDVSFDNASSIIASAASGFGEILAPGDHITVEGSDDNDGVYTVVSATDAAIVVSETLTTEEADALKVITITRGGIESGDTVLASYSYTPLASRTLKGGGLTEFTARVCRFTNEDSDGKVFRITVFSATPETGITLNFPADDAEDPMLCPVSMTGVPDTSLTAGEQLFMIEDEQHSS
jgi:hypothetical protein